MRFNKKLAISLLSAATLSGLLLAGCGNHSHPAHHEATTSSEVAKPHKHKARKSHKTHKKHHDSNRTDHTNNPIKRSHKATISHRSENDDANSPVVDLGNGITGQVDRGAGQVYVRFHMGEWTVTTHGNDVDENGDTAVNKARYLSNYFQDHQMPIPNGEGTLNYDTAANSATASWRTHVGGTKSISGNIHHVLNTATK